MGGNQEKAAERAEKWGVVRGDMIRHFTTFEGAAAKL